MKSKKLLLWGFLFFSVLLLSHCIAKHPPAGAFSVSELLQNPMYDTQVSIYGRVSLLGELRCPCFELTSDGETILVWYARSVDDDKGMTIISIEGIENGDQVTVTGELQQSSEDEIYEFRANKIEHWK